MTKMKLLYIFVIALASSEVYAAVIDTYKTCEDCKVYQLVGEDERVEYFVKYITRKYDEIIVRETIKVVIILIPPELVETVLDEAGHQKVICIPHQPDYSQKAFSEVRAAAKETYKTYKDYKVYEISGNKTVVQDFVKNLTLNYDDDDIIVNDKIIVRDVTARVNIMVPPVFVDKLLILIEMACLFMKLIDTDYSLKIIRPNLRLGSEGLSWNEYYDVPVINNYLTNVSKTYPNYARVVDIGKSYEGKSMLGLNINSGPEYSGKPAIFIESGIHAREWITPAAITYFINEVMTSNDPDIMALRDNFDWHIFPVVNPDGYHYTFTSERFWRKTRSKSSLLCYGADANRNWDHNWGKHGSSSNPCDYQTYAGSKPFSEVETKNIADYVSNIENLTAYLGFHSDAQMLLVPYSDSTEHTDNYDDLIQIGKVSLEYGKKVNGEDYRGPATAAEILYKASGGSMDWVREALGTPLVYTYELRGDFFQWPKERIPEQGDEVTQMILGLITEATNLGYF